MYVSKLPGAFVFRLGFNSAKCKLSIFIFMFMFIFYFVFFYFIFFFLHIFFQFLWTCLSKYTWNDMTDTIKHLKQHTSSTLYSVLYLVHPKIKFHISYWTKLWPTQIWNVCCSWKNKQTNKQTNKTKKKKKKKNLHLGQVFRASVET